LAKKFASHTNYHRADQFINDALAMYKAANREEKHKLLEQFAADKSCKWIVHVQETIRSEKLHHASRPTGG
jgi:trehalose-6-phosphate synthase